MTKELIDDREALALLIQRFGECDIPDFLLADFLLGEGLGFSRAAVPDAATERVERMHEITMKLIEARDERDAALAAVERLKEWLDENRPLRCTIDYGGEGEAQDDYEVIMSFFAALDGAPEPAGLPVEGESKP